MAIIGIDHVQVAAPSGCEAAARAFYGDLLGLDELTKPEPLRARGGCWFRVGPQELHVGVEEPSRRPARRTRVCSSMTWMPGPVGFAPRALPSSSMRTSPGCAASTVRTRTATGWNSLNLLTRADPGVLICRATGLGLAARPGLLPDASRTLAGRPDSGPYRQVGQSSATVSPVRREIDSITGHAADRSTPPAKRFDAWSMSRTSAHEQRPFMTGSRCGGLSARLSRR